MKGKVKDTGKVTLRSAWRKLHVDPRELQSEVCEGRGSSMCGIVLEEGECKSRFEYLGRLLLLENLELEARMEALQRLMAAKEKHVQSLNHHKGVVDIMKKKQKAYERQFHARTTDGTVDSTLKQKVDAYNDLVRGACRRVRKLEKYAATSEDSLSVEHHRVLRLEIQVRALKEEHAFLGRASCGFHMRPLPLVYVAGEAGSAGGSIQAGDCSLCGFPFPHSEMIVSACRHLYHPWCALVNFTEGTKCCALGCQQD